MNRRLTILLLCILAVPLARCASSKPVAPTAKEFAKSSYVPYWYADERTKSTIEIKNVLDTEVTVLPVLTTGTGDRVELEPVAISPRELRRVPIAARYFEGAKQTSSDVSKETRWGDGSIPGSLTGSAELVVLEPDNAGAANLAAWILVENVHQGMGVVTTFRRAPPDDGHPHELDGLWWLPSENAQAYYALQNTYSQDLEVHLSLTADGAMVVRKTINIPAGRHHLVDIRRSIGPGSNASVGGIKIQYDARPGERGGVLGRGIVADESRRFTTPLKLHEAKRGAENRKRTELHAPLAYFGRLNYMVPRSTDVITPYLLVSNTGGSDVTANGAVHGRSPEGKAAMFYLDTMALPAWSSVVIDLEKLRATHGKEMADGAAGLELWHDQGPNDIVAELVNVSDSWDMALYDRMTNTSFHDSAEHAAVSLRLDEAAHSFLILKNTTGRVQRPEVLLDVDGRESPYLVPDVEIPPWQVKVIDIKALRDGQEEDGFGVVLPKDLEYTSARIIGEPGAIVGSDPSVIFRENNTVVDFAPSCLVLVSQDPPGGDGGSSPTACRIHDLDGNPRISESPVETLRTPRDTFTWRGTVMVNRTSATTISSHLTGSLTRQSNSTVVAQVSRRGTVTCNAQCRPELACDPPCDDDAVGKFCIDPTCDRFADASVLILSGDSGFIDQINMDYVTFARTIGPDHDDNGSTNFDRIVRKYRCRQSQ